MSDLGLTSAVRQLVSQKFQPEDQALILDRLSKLKLPQRGNNIERIQLALVLVSRGNRDLFAGYAAGAESDWRNTLLAAGLAHDNWRKEVTLAGLPIL